MSFNNYIIVGQKCIKILGALAQSRTTLCNDTLLRSWAGPVIGVFAPINYEFSLIVKKPLLAYYIMAYGTKPVIPIIRSIVKA